MAGRGFMAARRRVAKARKGMGAAGQQLKKTIINQHAKQIIKMKKELKTIKNPVQKKLLAEQIKVELEELKWYAKGTK